MSSHLIVNSDTDVVEEEVRPLDRGDREEKIIAVKILSEAEISVRLSELGKTADGKGYAYLKATCRTMLLTDISSLVNFKHLQIIDVSKNNLDFNALQAITKLPFLVSIQGDHNNIKSAALNQMKYLQVLILDYNDIESIYDVYQPELSTLSIGYNKINTISLKTEMPTMRCFDLRYNAISDILDINFPNLDSLYLAGNKIRSLEGISKLPNLRVLHVRDNPIKLLDGFDASMTRLEYLNLRSCAVKTLIQVKKLRVLKGLQVLILKGTPYMGGDIRDDENVEPEEEDAELTIEVLAALQRLKRLNKHQYTEEERTEAKDLLLQWLEAGEDDEEEEEDAEEMLDESQLND